jgi:hypothetical protein
VRDPAGQGALGNKVSAMLAEAAEKHAAGQTEP